MCDGEDSDNRTAVLCDVNSLAFFPELGYAGKILSSKNFASCLSRLYATMLLAELRDLHRYRRGIGRHIASDFRYRVMIAEVSERLCEMMYRIGEGQGRETVAEVGNIIA